MLSNLHIRLGTPPSRYSISQMTINTQNYPYLTDLRTVNSDLDTTDAFDAFANFGVNNDLQLPRAREGADYTFQVNNPNDWQSHPSANVLPHINVSDQSLLGFSSGSFAPGLRSTSDPFHQLYQSLNEYPPTNSRHPSLYIQSGTLYPDIIDTAMEGNPDLNTVISSENKIPTPDSAPSPNSTAQGTPLTLSTPTSKRNKRQSDGQNPTCNEAPCNNLSFSDQACLSRHLREKHGSEKYYCPVSTCKRHRKGFPRRWNLLDHNKRCHPDQFSLLDEVLEEGSPARGGDGLRGENRLWARINELKEFRDEIDQEIKALERAEKIMNDYEQ
ncbi:hypothetical protein BKA61DRAFT_583041 [Leptodontidium sp. MPI-SDFR-AT-0119]|nr:hypothetical protein BKA61DRAFT_583041 [Leptodontidium sp. MPI-SDFR-AT-0119]